MIKRLPRESHYTTIPNEIINDSRLDWKELGLLIYLLSKPDNWNTNPKHLMKQRKTGRDGLYAIMKKLSECGYMGFTRANDGKTQWWVSEKPHTENPDKANPHTEKPDLENPDVLVKTESVVKRKSTKKKATAWQPPEWINQQAWQEFEQHRRDKRKPLTDLARQKAANALKILDHKQQQDCIDCTIQNSWTGLFPEKHRGTTHEASKRPTAGQSRTARLGDILREKYEEAVAEENGAADIRETADTLQGPVVSTTW